DKSFDSRAPFQPEIVVFSILSTDRSTQFVRVESDYLPAGYDPLSSTSDNSITNATVTVFDGTNTYRLRDTIIARTDTSRYDFPIHTFTLGSFVPVPGKTYQVAVQAAGYSNANASAIVPSRGYPGTAATTYVYFDNPGAYPDDVDLLCNALLGANSKGFVGRLFVDYDVLIGTEWTEGRIEVPLAFADPKVPDLNFVTYPQFTSRTADRMVLSFKNGVYKSVLTSLASGKYKSNKLIFNRVVFQLLQADKNLFDYYNTTHAFRDAASTRLDEPLFSNVSGGSGIVGAYTLDSLVHLLPENFPYNNR
ncbi:MAG TPA: DUF4249 family protein, partial [Bacteroidota bacterium]|nr:DUF4249 family protein [Bacteroidota bacterium]